MTGTPERLGGKPRENADDAYATFMDMSQDTWQALLLSLLSGGALTDVELEGLMRALEDRKAT